MNTMDAKTETRAFVEYLHEHSVTKALAGEFAQVLVLRGRADVLAGMVKTAPRSRRIAS